MNFNEIDFAKVVASDKRYPEIFGPTEYPCMFKSKKMFADIYTQDFVYECKFGANSWNAVGQVMSYAMVLEKKAAIIIFIRTNPKHHDKDLVGFEILKKMIKTYKLDIKVLRFYVNQTDGKISSKNTLVWEGKTPKADKEALEDALKQIEDTNVVSKGILSTLKGLIVNKERG